MKLLEVYEAIKLALPLVSLISVHETWVSRFFRKYRSDQNQSRDRKPEVDRLKMSGAKQGPFCH